MTENREVIRSRRDLIKAKNMAQWAAVGLLLPLLGIIIAIMARQRANYVIEDDDNWEEIEHVRTLAGMWIILSIGMGLLWYTFYWYVSP